MLTMSFNGNFSNWYSTVLYIYIFIFLYCKNEKMAMSRV